MFNVKIAATLVVALMMFSGAAVMVGTEDNDATGTGGFLVGTGYNSEGQQGDGTTTNVTTPTQIGSYENVTMVACSNNMTFFIDSGRLFGMGDNAYGQQGDGTLVDITSPKQIGSYDNVTMVACSLNNTVFINDGKLYAMGYNDYGSLGIGSSSTSIRTPTQVGSFTNVTYVDVSNNNIAFIDDGKLYCAGRNETGILGISGASNIPVQIGSFTNVKFCILGGFNLLFLDGTILYGIGSNSNGILGDGTTTNSSTPILISEDVTDIGFDRNNTLCYVKNSQIYHTGSAISGVGAATSSPTVLSGYTNVSEVEVGSGSGGKNIAFIDDGKLYGSGDNTYGQISGNLTTVSNITQIGTFTNVDKLVLSGYTTFFKNNNDWYSLGYNNYGQQGDTTTTNVKSPKQLNIENITDVAVSRYTTFFIVTPPTATVTISVNDSDYGSVSPASITDIEPGDTITIANNTITYGETVVTATPAEADAQYTYAFSGFVDSNSDPVTGTVTVNSDMAITAVFTATTNQYAVTISPNDPSYGSVSPSSLTVDYGTAITVSGTSLTIGSQAITATASDATAQYTYAFDSWTVPGAVETVTGPITITGTFTATVNEYTITIESADVTLGTVDVSEVQDVPYGTAITVSGDTVTIGDTVITATVIGDGLVTKWSVSDGATVQGDMTITASFVEPSSIENTLMGMLPLLLIIVLVITAAGGVFASGGDPESLIKLIICLAVGVIVISVFVLPIAGGL